MAVVFTQANQSVTASVQDIITAALTEINVTAAGEVPDPQDTAWGLQKLQRLIDQWNARRELVFAVSFLQYTLQANHAPHTIGPGGDFPLAVRPAQVMSGAFILNAGTANPVDTPLNIRDADWWAQNPLKSMVSSICTELYYEPTNPLGQLNFYPICNIANPVRLEVWQSLQQAIALGQTLGLPLGYWDALVTDLAVRLCISFEKPVPPDLKEQWNRAMRIIESNNDQAPTIQTNGAGMPTTQRGGRPDYNFLTGLRE